MTTWQTQWQNPADNVETMIEAQDRSAQLSSDHRQVIDLVYHHEKTIEEVTEIIQVPKNTVKTRMFYARKSLEKLLTASGCRVH